MTTQIDVFVDYVCPFCLLVEPAIEELKRDRDVEVTIRPFELRPDPVPTLRPEDEYLPRIWRDAVYPMSERVDVPMTLPSVSRQPRTDKAFMVLQLAQQHGLAEAYTAAMFSAFFQQDRNIGHDEVIIDVATSVGLDSVPGIVVNNQVLRGVPSTTRLKKIVDQLTRAEPAAAPSSSSELGQS